MKTYNDAIKEVKAKHKEYSDLGREFHKVQQDTKQFFDRALNAAAKEGLLDYNNSNQPTVIKSNKANVWYKVYSQEESIKCFLVNMEPSGAAHDKARDEYPSYGSIKTIVSRLKKSDDVEIFLRLGKLLKFLENYSE